MASRTSGQAGYGSVTVHHAPGFQWSNIRAAVLRPEAAAGQALGRPVPESGPSRQPIAPLLQEAVSFALEVAITRRPPTQIVQDLALNLRCSAMREGSARLSAVTAG